MSAVRVAALRPVVFALCAVACGQTGEGGVESGAAQAPEPASAPSPPGGPAAWVGSSEPSPTSAPSAPALASSSPAALGPPGMVRVPASVFLMGSPAGTGNPEERPLHERVVAAFFIDATEVTTARYRACVSAGACKTTLKSDDFCNEHRAGKDHHPINCVDYASAAAYCAHVGKRLPTEAEWELAASGGDGRTFSWGEADPTTKTACFSHPGGTCPVASFAPGAFGLYDMSGNVWEWTSTWFALFPEDPEHGERRVFKGGSWSRRWPKWLRVKNRSHWQPEKSNSWLGFRCAQTVLPLECPADAAPRSRGAGCERVRGEPTCGPERGWNGSECTRLGADGRPSATAEPRFSAAEIPDPSEPISVARSPQDDPDCVKSYPGKPIAYRWTGNTWEARVKLVKERGCTRRDNGARWVGACCRS
ncbi:MAG: SUMF1/EgtB/PvdO family nonheme iron enzyme [Polyangiaceae bacterium]|jgi:formylglycine-generating enzyme required for sulfatase activity|nr:SUMF1/EgtB/PvdO family nonheme iron enzyme [Polyangiaceae bacterium]